MTPASPPTRGLETDSTRETLACFSSAHLLRRVPQVQGLLRLPGCEARLMDSVRTVVNTVVNWLSPPDKPAGEETPPGAANSTTPRLGTMRDPSAAPSALKRAAPVEDGTLPEQFYTLNPEFLDDPDKWSYKDLQVTRPPDQRRKITLASSLPAHGGCPGCAAPGEAAGRAWRRQRLAEAAGRAALRVQPVRPAPPPAGSHRAAHWVFVGCNRRAFAAQGERAGARGGPGAVAGEGLKLQPGPG